MLDLKCNAQGEASLHIGEVSFRCTVLHASEATTEPPMDQPPTQHKREVNKYWFCDLRIAQNDTVGVVCEQTHSCLWNREGTERCKDIVIHTPSCEPRPIVTLDSRNDFTFCVYR